MAFDPNDPAGLTDDEITRRALARGDDPNYWLGKREEFGRNDPAYFWKRMSDPPGPPAGATGGADTLVYKTLPQVSSALTPQLPSYAATDATPGAAFNQAPPESRLFGSAGGGAATLDPRAIQRDALVKMLGRRG